jgi:flagellar protein FlgJ
MNINTDLLLMQHQLGQKPKLNERLDNTAQEFEAFFLFTAIKEMTAGIDTDPAMGGGGFAEQVWRDVLSEKIADQIAKSGGIGIADSIRKQLLMYQEAQQ